MQFSWRLAHGMLFFAGGACCAEGFVCLQFQHGYERCHMAASFFCTWIPCDSSHFAGSPVVIVFILYSVYIILYIYDLYIYAYIITHTCIYIYLVITVESSWDLLSPLRQRHPAPVGTQPRQTIPGRNAWVATIFRRPQACCACDVPFCNPTCQ